MLGCVAQTFSFIFEVLSSILALSVGCSWVRVECFFRTCSGWRELPHPKLIPNPPWVGLLAVCGPCGARRPSSIGSLYWERLWRAILVPLHLSHSSTQSSVHCHSPHSVTRVFTKTTPYKLPEHKFLPQSLLPRDNDLFHQIILSTYYVPSPVPEAGNILLYWWIRQKRFLLS